MHVFTGVCLTMGGGGGAIPACIAGDIPTCLALSRGGALQVSRPTPKGAVEGDLAGGGVSAWGGVCCGGACSGVCV